MIRTAVRTLTIKPDQVMILLHPFPIRQSGLEELQAAIEKHYPRGRNISED
jgi:hypothetical protein